MGRPGGAAHAGSFDGVWPLYKGSEVCTVHLYVFPRSIMSHGKQFTLYSHNIGPNPWYAGSCFCSYVTESSRTNYCTVCRKVEMVLRELGLTFERKLLDFGKNEHKIPEHTKLNPNGRVPTIIDHHYNDFVIW